MIVENFNPASLAIGIDLGATNSCVGYFVNNNVEIITTASGEKTVPSFVFYDGTDKCIVGEQALAQLKTNPNQVVYDSKRMIGMNFNENVVNRNKSFWTFTVAKNENNRPVYVLGKNQKVLPEDVSSEILKELIKMAQDKIGTDKIKSAVITVPDHFLAGQKEATIHAATCLAGIEKVKLITESIAAAYAYGFDHRNFDEYNLFVFDLGGGTCDVSIVKVDKSEFKVIGYSGDTQLGGRDYDNRLIEYFNQKFKDLRIFEDTSELTIKRKMRLREACENLKIALSHPAKVSEIISLDDVMPGLPDETLHYKDFKKIVSDLTLRCRKLCIDALEETRLQTDDIDEVLLVGGSSKMRVIRDMLKDIFPNIELSEAINPDEAVAYGATLRAARLLDPEKSKGFRIVDTLAIGIGVALPENQYRVMIKRNTPIPAKVKHTFPTTFNNQTAMTFNIYEGERLLADQNLFIMSLELQDLPKKRAGEVHVTLELELNENGILKATAKGEGKEISQKLIYDEKRATGQKTEDMLADMEINCDRDRMKDRINTDQTHLDINKNLGGIKWVCEEKIKKETCESGPTNIEIYSKKQIENLSNLAVLFGMNVFAIQYRVFKIIEIINAPLNEILVFGAGNDKADVRLVINTFNVSFIKFYIETAPLEFYNIADWSKFLENFDTSQIFNMDNNLKKFSFSPKIKTRNAVCLIIKFSNTPDYEKQINERLSRISIKDLEQIVVFLIFKTTHLLNKSPIQRKNLLPLNLFQLQGMLD